MSSPRQRPKEHPNDLVGGRFKLLRQVGSGGMGDVWAAVDVKTHERYALKVLHPDRTDDHSSERFQHEATVGALLAHPNVTRVHELLELEDGTLVLVMELLVGESLRTYLRMSPPLSSAEAVALMLPVLSALHHAHGHGVIHRDLKPANIFLHVDATGLVIPKLLDFGIAKSEDSTVLTRTGDALGTPSYMSPEQVRALSLDGRSDLFAIGVVLYECIVGQNPFAAPSPSAVLARVLELDVDPDPKIDPRVWLEISRAISKQAYERHSSADELAKALTSAVGESPAALARFLRRNPPLLDLTDDTELEADTQSSTMQIPAEVVQSGTRAIAEQPPSDSIRPQVVPPPQGRVLLGISVGAALLGLLVAILIVSLRHRPEQTVARPPAPTRTVAAQHVEEGPPTPDVPTVDPSAAEPPPTAAPEEDPHPRLKATRRPTTPPKPRAPDPRALGRTPGF